MDYGFGTNGNQFYNMMPANSMQAQKYSMPPQQFFPQQPLSLSGKMVSSPGDIMPGDVPMNGTPCFFPMQDGSAIYAKMWNADGTISTMRFVPEQPAPQEPTQLDRIEAMLANMVKPKEAADEQHD